MLSLAIRERTNNAEIEVQRRATRAKSSEAEVWRSAVASEEIEKDIFTRMYSISSKTQHPDRA
jgi:hypothetical protein